MKIAGIIKSSLIDYPGKASTVIFLGGCNFRCGYCHNPELVRNPFAEREKGSGAGAGGIRREDFMDFLRRRIRFLDGVCISGGEPTLHGELPLLIEEVKRLGFSVKLDTNGTNPQMLRDLIAKGLVDYVAMDIKGPADQYRQIAGLSADIDTIRESAQILIDAYRYRSLYCEFRTTVCRELLTEHDLERMVKEYPGAPPWYFQRFRNPGRILDDDGTYSAYTLEEMEAMGKRLCVSVR